MIKTRPVIISENATIGPFVKRVKSNLIPFDNVSIDTLNIFKIKNVIRAEKMPWITLNAMNLTQLIFIDFAIEKICAQMPNPAKPNKNETIITLLHLNTEFVISHNNPKKYRGFIFCEKSVT